MNQLIKNELSQPISLVASLITIGLFIASIMGEMNIPLPSFEKSSLIFRILIFVIAEVSLGFFFGMFIAYCIKANNANVVGWLLATIISFFSAWTSVFTIAYLFGTPFDIKDPFSIFPAMAAGAIGLLFLIHHLVKDNDHSDYFSQFQRMIQRAIDYPSLERVLVAVEIAPLIIVVAAHPS